MNAKRKGSRIEHKVKAVLERHGYLVQRAAGSLGVFDLIAVNATDWRCIQVKGGKHPYCSPKERLAIQQFPVPPNTRKEIWYWEDYARLPKVVILE